MSPDVRELLTSAAAAPRRPLDTGAVLGRARSLRRRRVALAFAALVPVAAAAAVVRLPADRPANYVTAPAAPGVAFGRLADGTRVYVVRHADGTVTVLDAVSTHRPFGAGKQIGWCRGAGFEDPFHGSRWDERGVYVFGPAASDLPYYRVRPHGEGFVVGERVDRPARGHGRPGGAVCDPSASPPSAPVVWDGPGGGEDRTYDSVADLPEGRLARFTGVLFLELTGGRLCDADGSPCLPYAGGRSSHRARTPPATYLARREGDRLTELVSVWTASPSAAR